VAALVEAAGHVAHYHGAVLPRAMSHALGLVVTTVAVVWWLGLEWLGIGFVAALVLIPFAALGSRRLRRAQQRSFDHFVEVSGDYQVLLDGAVELRAHGVETRHAARLDRGVAQMASAERRAKTVSVWLNVMPLAVAFIIALVPLRRALPELSTRAVGIAEVGVLGGASLVFIVGLLAALQGWSQARPFRATLERFVSPSEVVAPSGSTRIDTSQAVVMLDAVGLRYPEAHDATPHDVSFVWRPGRGLALCGANGAGKSTLAWCLVGLLRPTSGRLTFADVEHDAIDWVDFRSRLAFVPQHGFVAPERSIAWHLRLLTSVALTDAAIDEALDQLGLSKILARRNSGAPPREVLAGDLSGGERKRMQLARVLLGSPELVVLDEPEAGLDAPSRDWLKTFVQALSERSRVILIAHDPSIRPDDFLEVHCSREQPSQNAAPDAQPHDPTAESHNAG
jgi:ABC-type transport system involved in cytochrome bd biosynthesis fused ATPase/permease subunit